MIADVSRRTRRSNMSSRAPWPLSIGFLVLAVGTGHGSAPPVVLVDALGDPLPPGALARYGTLRLRHTEPIRWLGFTPDGKGLVSGGEHEIRAWDVATGRLLARRQSTTWLGGWSENLALAPE